MCGVAYQKRITVEHYQFTFKIILKDRLASILGLMRVIHQVNGMLLLRQLYAKIN
ncbi:MAG: hypothetical protein ACTSP4_10160 [Candidatus Hodarchaeales archaeon]